MVKIEKNIPMPKFTIYGKRSILQNMKVGDSIFVEDEQEKNSVRHAMRYRGLKPMCRRQDNGWRIWRISDD
jgi:hypothetical protein